MSAISSMTLAVGLPVRNSIARRCHEFVTQSRLCGIQDRQLRAHQSENQRVRGGGGGEEERDRERDRRGLGGIDEQIENSRTTGPMSSLGLNSNEQRPGLGFDPLKGILQLCGVLERVQRHHSIVVICRGHEELLRENKGGGGREREREGGREGGSE